MDVYIGGCAGEKGEKANIHLHLLKYLLTALFLHKNGWMFGEDSNDTRS